MAVTVTLRIFSGLRDPSWELDDRQIAELKRRLSAAVATSLLKPPGLKGRLGYSGFAVRSTWEPGLEPEIYVDRGLVDIDRFAPTLVVGPEFELWLLGTGSPTLSRDLSDYVSKDIGSARYIDTQKDKDRPEFSWLLEPPYDPGKWNNDSTIREDNNCYNYANDKITNSFAQPGRGSGTVGPSPPDCLGTGAASERDGLIRISNPSSTPSEGQYVALVIAPFPSQPDFHWYRRDDNGMWSHKRGTSPVQNTDFQGELISSPEGCDRGPYTIFCGYYHAIPVDVVIL
jgi:hypothetical protein